LRDNNRNKYANEIIKLSVEHSLASEFTSFVVVDEVVHTSQSGDPLTVNVPQYGGQESAMYDMLDCAAPSASIRYMSSAPMRGGAMLCSANSTRGSVAKSMKSMTKSKGSSKMMTKSYSASSDDECDEEEEVMMEQASELQQQSGVFSKQSVKASSSSMFGSMNLFGSSNKESMKRQDECERAPASAPSSTGFSFGKLFGGSKSSKNVDYLLNFKNVDGSFRYDEKVLKTIGVSLDKFNTVVSSQGVSQDYLLNVLVLAYIKSVNDSKYTMVQKMLESWLSSNKSTEVPESVTQELLTV
jgi:hypothetical protein